VDRLAFRIVEIFPGGTPFRLARNHIFGGGGRALKGRSRMRRKLEWGLCAEEACVLSPREEEKRRIGWESGGGS